MSTNNTPAPQWAVDTAKAITAYLHREFASGFTYDEAEVAAIIARHAPQPTAPTAKPEQPVATGGLGGQMLDPKEQTGRAATGTPDVGATPRTDVIRRKIIADLRSFLHEETDRIDLSASVDSTCELVSQLERKLATEERMRRTMETRHGEVVAQLAEARAEVERLTRELADVHRTWQSERDAHGAAYAQAMQELAAMRGLLERAAKMRPILRGLLASAKAEAGDVLTDPTWNHDYLFGFKLTVKDLRAIDRYLATERKDDGKS